MAKAKKPFSWLGGKGMLVTKLLKYVPNHTYYLEAYGGSEALLFSKKPSEW